MSDSILTTTNRLSVFLPQSEIDRIKRDVKSQDEARSFQQRVIDPWMERVKIRQLIDDIERQSCKKNGKAIHFSNHKREQLRLAIVRGASRELLSIYAARQDSTLMFERRNEYDER